MPIISARCSKVLSSMPSTLSQAMAQIEFKSILSHKPSVAKTKQESWSMVQGWIYQQTPSRGEWPLVPTWTGKLNQICWSWATDSCWVLGLIIAQTESPKQYVRTRPVQGWIVAIHTVVEPVYLFSSTASFTKHLGSVIYFQESFATNSSIIFTNLFEYNPGSIPESAHPPTPSATTKICLEAHKASSPPLAYFQGWGRMVQPDLKLNRRDLAVVLMKNLERCKRRFMCGCGLLCQLILQMNVWLGIIYLVQGQLYFDVYFSQSQNK